MFDADEEEEDDGKQRVLLRDDTISLDQVGPGCDLPTSVLIAVSRRPDALPCRVLGGTFGVDPMNNSFPFPFPFFVLPHNFD